MRSCSKCVASVPLHARDQVYASTSTAAAVVRRKPTVLIPRELLSPVGGVAAAYTVYDARKCAPLRARLRLCASRLVEHRELHHEVVAEKTCRACGIAGTYESVEHIVFVCPAFGG